MGYYKSLMSNIGQISKQILPGSPIINDEVGLTSLNYSTQQRAEDREAIFPQWFFSSRLGQPRRVDTLKLRELSRSPWIQMVITTFKKQIQTIPWKINVVDEEDESDHDADIKKIMEFMENVNDNQQTIDDINAESITDIAEIDAGVFNYVYTADSYTLGDIPVYNAWGQITGNDTGLILTNKSDSRSSEEVAGGVTYYIDENLNRTLEYYITVKNTYDLPQNRYLGRIIKTDMMTETVIKIVVKAGL